MSELDVARFHVRCALLSLSYFGQGYSQIMVVAGTAIVDIAAPVCSCHCEEGEESLKEMHTRRKIETRGIRAIDLPGQPQLCRRGTPL